MVSLFLRFKGRVAAVVQQGDAFMEDSDKPTFDAAVENFRVSFFLSR